ncbi:KB07 protein [Capsaspora owczarzaki ATCC 30864]|nr:KB07 protein [Capsaspora owczarzaki ATCC 30864]|eukprot:XP_004344420.1 KB07 protein [Capsaspora owczarzaki ATCC 30864]
MSVLGRMRERQKALWPRLNHDATPLPSAWNPKDKFNLLELSHNNCKVTYKGQGKGDTDAAAVRANAFIPPECGVYYFEMLVRDKGREGYIGVGVATSNVSLNRLPGWERQSWGYHGDDGHTFASSNTGTVYGPTYTSHDVVGCCINFVDNTCFYTKNGTALAVAFRNMRGKLFPIVGLRTQGEVVEANFGQDPFVFDLEGYMEETKAKALATIKKRTLAESRLFTSAPEKAFTSLIASYLVHHGYTETARAFAQDSNTELQESEESIRSRQHIRELVLGGQIDESIAAVNQLIPGLLASETELHFKLKCRKFIEMVRAGATTSESLMQIMQFGQELQQMSEAEQVGAASLKDLEDAFSLLAYPEPTQSPVAGLLNPAQREPLADELNCTMLQWLNLPPVPALELAVRQSVCVLNELYTQGVGMSGFVSVDDFVPESKASKQ